MALRKQLSVTLINEVGEGAKLCGILAAAGINIEAVSAFEYTEGGVVRLIVSDEKKAASLLRGKGYSVIVRVVVALDLANKPGVLGRAMERLARGGRNIRYCYGSTAPGDGRATVFFGVDDPVKADLLFAAKA